MGLRIRVVRGHTHGGCGWETPAPAHNAQSCPAPLLQEWSYLRGGLTTIDRDYGIFNKIHHDIGTHVVHHLFPQVGGTLGSSSLLVRVQWCSLLLRCAYRGGRVQQARKYLG